MPTTLRHDPTPTIERLVPPGKDEEVRALAALLLDAVASGAAVSFLATLTLGQAEDWWRKTLREAHPSAIFLAARDGGAIVGTVQMHPAWAPNQPHRAEIAKLLVDRHRRGEELGAHLMRAVESEAARAGFRLLTLDAKRGAAADHLYRKLGWIHAGTIPDFALDPDGVTPHDAVLFYKHLKP